MTALFYTALHEVRAFFLDDQIRLRNHDHTRTAFRVNRPRTAAMSHHYDKLYQFSLDARYRNTSHTAADFKRAERALEAIRHEIDRLAKQPQTLTRPPSR